MKKFKTSCFLSVDRDLDAVLKSVEQLKNEGFDAVEPISLRNFWDDSVAVYNAEKIKEKVSPTSVRSSEPKAETKKA